VAVAASHRRRVLVMADQGVSSLSNVVVTIIVARSVTGAAFGAFAAATIGYALTIGIARAFVGEPLLSLYSHVAADDRRRRVPDMLGAAIVVSLLCGAAVALVGAVLSGPTGPALVALGVTMPLLIVQDFWRYAFIVDRPEMALAVDLAWLAGVLVVLPFAPDGAGPTWYVLAWGLTSGAGAVLGCLVGGLTGPPHLGRWLVDHRGTGVRFFGEFLTGSAVSQLVLACVGAIAGLGVLGAVRASQVFYGPLNTVHAGIYLVVVPEGAQARDRPGHLRKIMVIASLGVATVSVALMAVGLLLPDSWGTALFGATWPDAQELMLPMCVAMVVGGLATGGYAGIRSLGAVKESLRARLQAAVPQFVFPVAGVALAAGWGYAAGFAVAQAAMATVWWLAFRRALAARTAAPDGAGAAAAARWDPTVTSAGVP
jgi:O-antigen/teichoic acid export membrane protein